MVLMSRNFRMDVLDLIAGDDVFMNVMVKPVVISVLLIIRFKRKFWRLQPLMRRKTKFIM